MKLQTRWKLYTGMGAGALILTFYVAWKTLRYIENSQDWPGVAIFAFVGLCLFVAALLHWYMAAGFKLGLVESVTGSREIATVHKSDGRVVASAKIQFLRKLDGDDLSLTSQDRYVFFICEHRPWVCIEAQFFVT